MTTNEFHLKDWFSQIVLATVVFVLIFSIKPVQAAEEVNLMERWLVNDSLSRRTVDNSLWQGLLDTYFIDGMFNYAGVTAEDRTALKEYVTMLGRTDVDRLNRDEQMAFWINAFNANIVNIILEEFPVRSINDIGGSFFSRGPWKEKRFRVYQINLSLNDIYHRILRPIWQDNRVHYALSCGGISCPTLLPTAFSGKTIEEELVKAQSTFINFGPAIRQIRDQGIVVSRIYDWYGVDFGNDELEILNHIKANAKGNVAVQLAPVTRITSYSFDWDLTVPFGQKTD